MIKRYLTDKSRVCVLISIISIFIIFFAIFRKIPMMYDGWASKFYYNSQNGIINWIIYVCSPFYNFMNGRIMSNIVCGFLESFKSEIPLDFFNAGVIAFIFFFAHKISKNGNEKKTILSSLLFLSLVLLMDYEMRNDVLFYANAPYVVPVLLLLIYYWLYFKFIEKGGKKLLVIMSILSFSIGTWIEHIAVGFSITLVLMNILTLIEYGKDKLKILIPSFFAVLGTIIMFMSPGMHMSRVIVSDNGFIVTIIANIKHMYVHIICRNSYLILIMLVIILIGLLKSRKRILLLIIPNIALILLTSISAIYNLVGIRKLEFILKLFPTDENIYFNFYLALFVILLTFILIVSSAFLSKRRKELLYLIGLFIFSMGPLCLTPNAGSRISSIAFFILVLITIILYLELPSVKTEKLMKYCIFVLTFVAMDKMVLLMKRINEVTQERNLLINEARMRQKFNEWDYNKQVLLLPKYFANDVRHDGVVFVGDFHYSQFLEASGLDPKTRVLFVDSSICYETYSDKEGIGVNLINWYDDTQYKYIVKYSSDGTNYKDIYNSGYVSDRNNYYKTYGMMGYYKYEVYYVNNSEEKIVEDVNTPIRK